MDYVGMLFTLLLIFFARVLDVTLGTVRIILVSKGMKKVATFLGFFEILIWLVAIVKIIQNLTNPLSYVAYAGGFAAGTYIGMLLEEKLAIGTTLVQVVTRSNPDNLVDYLKKQGYAVTRMRGEGYQGPVHVLFSIVKRKKIPQVIYIIKHFNPNAFYTIEDIQYVSEAVGPIEPEIKEKIRASIKKYGIKPISDAKMVGGKLKSTKTYFQGKINHSLDKIIKRK